MRASYNAYTSEREESRPSRLAPYMAQGETGPLIATDAEVGVIACHAARFALDALQDKEPSAFSILHVSCWVGKKVGFLMNLIKPYLSIQALQKLKKNQTFQMRNFKKVGGFF